MLEVRQQQLPHEHVQLHDEVRPRARLRGNLRRVLRHAVVQAAHDGGDGREGAAGPLVGDVGAW